MKTTTNNHSHTGNHTGIVRSRGVRSEKRIRSLIEAACSARASTSQMTLQDWIEVEHEVKRRLHYEF